MRISFSDSLIITRHRARTSTSVWRYVVIARKPVLANPPNSAHLGGTPYHSPKLHPGPCSSVGMWRDTDRQTDARDQYTRLFIISGPLCWNWYSSANKSYFCAKIYQFVVLIIPHTICSKMTFTVQSALCLHETNLTSEWLSRHKHSAVVNSSTRLLQRPKVATLNTICCKKPLPVIDSD